MISSINGTELEYKIPPLFIGEEDVYQEYYKKYQEKMKGFHKNRGKIFNIMS